MGNRLWQQIMRSLKKIVLQDTFYCFLTTKIMHLFCKKNKIKIDFTVIGKFIFKSKKNF